MGEEGGEQPPAWAVQLLDSRFLWEKAALSQQGGKWNFANLLCTTVAHFAAWLPPLTGPTLAIWPPTPVPPGTVGPQNPCVLNHRQGGWPAVSPSSSGPVSGLLLLLIFSAPSQGTWQQGQWGPQAWTMGF